MTKNLYDVKDVLHTMNFLFLTIADFGKLSNLKTPESLAVIKGLQQTKSNLRVICRDSRDFYGCKTEKALPFGRWPLFLMEGIIRYLPGKRRSSRYRASMLLDAFSSWKIRKKYDLSFLLPPFYIKSLQKIKKSGGIIVVYGGTGHPANTIKLNRRFNIKLNEEYDRRMMECINASDYVVALSDFVKETYIENGYPEDRIYVTYPGTDPERFTVDTNKLTRDTIFRVVCVANYGLLKGFQYLFQAWTELALDNAELVIIGEPTSKKMKEIAEFYTTKPYNIRAVGFADPLPFYQSADLLVHPSLTEGSARVIYEAMACGLPIICTKESGSVVRNNIDGFIVPSEDIISLKEKILFFYRNPLEKKKMGETARQAIVDHYTWNHFAERIFLAVHHICKKNGIHGEPISKQLKSVTPAKADVQK